MTEKIVTRIMGYQRDGKKKGSLVVKRGTEAWPSKVFFLKFASRNF